MAEEIIHLTSKQAAELLPPDKAVINTSNCPVTDQVINPQKKKDVQKLIKENKCEIATKSYRDKEYGLVIHLGGNDYLFVETDKAKLDKFLEQHFGVQTDGSS
jgi:hypothetical protein